MYIIITLVQIISTEVICIVQLMAILLAADVSDKAMDYTMVMLIAMFLFIWLIFYLFNVLWRDDDDDQLLQSQVKVSITSLIMISLIMTSLIVTS